jgi:hypothetical protein
MESEGRLISLSLDPPYGELPLPRSISLVSGGGTCVSEVPSHPSTQGLHLEVGVGAFRLGMALCGDSSRCGGAPMEGVEGKGDRDSKHPP